MTVAVVLVFALTYVLVAGRRLSWLPIGRPAGALLGAVLMVAIGALTPKQAYDAIDHDTLALLLGMMLVTAYLERAGIFGLVARAALGVCGTGFELLVAVAVVAAVLSAFLVNDTVCVFLTPVVIAVARRAQLPLSPFLLALATSANIGSSATLVGNPQDMIVGHLSGLPFARFALVATPAAVVGVVVNVALLWAYYRKDLAGPLAPPADEPAPSDGTAVRTGLVLLGIVAGFFAGLHMGFTALGGAVALIVLDRRDPREAFAKVDFPLLVFFASLFVVVAGLASTGLVDAAWTAAGPWLGLDRPAGVAAFTALVVAGSNLVSNVPLVLLAAPHVQAFGDAGWVLLAFASTIAGNLTLIGSVANLIVAEIAREHHAIGFVEYLKFGAVSTVLVLLTGIPTILAMSALVR